MCAMCIISKSFHYVWMPGCLPSCSMQLQQNHTFIIYSELPYRNDVVLSSCRKQLDTLLYSPSLSSASSSSQFNNFNLKDIYGNCKRYIEWGIREEETLSRLSRFYI